MALYCCDPRSGKADGGTLMKKTYIVANSVRCTLCGDNIFSSHVHDFVTCKCGNISVDGGQDYLRRSGGMETHVDTSIVMFEHHVKFITETLTDMREHTEGTDDTYAIVMCILSSLMNTGYMLVNTSRDLDRQFLTYHGEDARTAVVWALDTGRTNVGIVLAVIRTVRDAGFLKEKDLT